MVGAERREIWAHAVESGTLILQVSKHKFVSTYHPVSVFSDEQTVGKERGRELGM